MTGGKTFLQHVRILDPACGSGNFLYVALLRLKDLEKEAILYGNDNGLGSFLPMVSPSQLYGIEINTYAHDLAQMTVWIGWLQWIRVNGFGFPADPILRPLTDNIRLMDAILAIPGDADVPSASEDEDAAGTAAPPGVEPAWPKVDFIIGNPPFLGGNRIRKELGGDYVDRLFALYDNRLPAFSDLCCYWFERARAHIAAGNCKRAGLLATQGIRGGANRQTLKRIKESGDIFWAESDRPWILDGANVHVSMVAFDNGEEKTHTLDGEPVPAINSNLTASADVTTATVLNANMHLCFMGPSAKAPFDIEEKVAIEFCTGGGNPNGKPNSDIVRPVASAVDIARGSRRKWTIDFGLMDFDEASQYEAPFEYVRETILPVREKRRDDYRGMWWQYARPRPELRAAMDGLQRFIATPGVSKHRLFAWFPIHVLCNQGTLVFARPDDLFFGVLHSRLHEVWALRMGTRLETRPRYTPSTCFDTFPFPPGVLAATEDLPDELAAIADAAKKLNELREAWLNPPEWTREEVLTFPGTVGGPWHRYIDPDTVTDAPSRGSYGGASRGAFKVGTVRYPRLVPNDDASAARLKKRTLTHLYNERPAWLAACHEKLDAVVAAAYGWPADLPDEAILERLLALNQAATEGGR